MLEDTKSLDAAQMISLYSHDECCKEIMLKLIYLAKGIINLTVYLSLKIASMESNGV